MLSPLAKRPFMLFFWATAIVGGVGYSISGVLWETVVGENIPGRALSRVSSYDWLGSIALRPIGLALVGPVAVAIGAPLRWVCRSLRSG
jgi:hypothetical protein